MINIETKQIILSSNHKKEMTFEEVVEQFEPMLRKKIWNTNNRSLYNKVETEDFMQELMVELWKAYDQYDPELGNCFSTYLHFKLLKGVRDVTYSRYFQKNQHNGLISMDAKMGNTEMEIKDLFKSDADTSEDLEYKELINLILDNIEEEEVELLKVIIDRQIYTVQDYANKHNITRQGANQRVIKLRKKLKNIIKYQYL